MTRYAIDAPTLLRLVTDGVEVDASSHQLVAPNKIRSQALQLLLDEVRAGRLDDRAALDRHEKLTTTKIRLLGDRVSRRAAWDLAREHGWDTIDDAEYLAVARLQADALVTIDERMIARASGIVVVAPFHDLLRNG